MGTTTIKISLNLRAALLALEPAGPVADALAAAIPLKSGLELEATSTLAVAWRASLAGWFERWNADGRAGHRAWGAVTALKVAARRAAEAMPADPEPVADERASEVVEPATEDVINHDEVEPAVVVDNVPAASAVAEEPLSLASPPVAEVIPDVTVFAADPTPTQPTIPPPGRPLVPQAAAQALPDDDAHTLGRRWAAGEPIADLAREARCSWQALHSRLTPLGYRQAPRPRPVVPAAAPAGLDGDAMHAYGRRFAAGESVKALAREAGIAWQTLHIRLDARGYRRAARPPTTPAA